MFLADDDSVFIEDYFRKEQLQEIIPDVFLRLKEMIKNNFEKLEAFTKRVFTEYVEIYKHNSEGRSKLPSISYLSLTKALDPARTKVFYYLLIYSLYETGLIGVPRCMAVVEKIFTNIITLTRLMAYMHNDKVKEKLKLKKLISSSKLLSTKSRNEQSIYSKTNFIYTDFTKPLFGQPFKKHDLFSKNADLMRKKINDNIQLIINEEFGDNPAYKNLCEDYNSKALRLNKKILFESFPFKIEKHVANNYLRENMGYDKVMYGKSYLRNILSYLMVTDTKSQIKDLADIRLKSVFILIFISKICLCNVTDCAHCLST